MIAYRVVAVQATTDRPILVNPDSPITEIRIRDIETAAQLLRRNVVVLNAQNEAELPSAFATIVNRRIGALVVTSDNVLSSMTENVTALAQRHSVPTITAYHDFAAGGGSISYGSSIPDAHRLVGLYCTQIRKARSPLTSPSMQAAKVELIVNLKAAKSLGITVPLALLAAPTR